jgi:hypothetical protein
MDVLLYGAQLQPADFWLRFCVAVTLTLNKIQADMSCAE